mgnify:CR=1 FL=1
MENNSISIVIDGVGNSGGTDRVASVLSTLLSDNNYKVTIYTFNKLTPYYPISQKVNIVYPDSEGFLSTCNAISNKIVKSKSPKTLVISMGKLSSIFIPILKLKRYNGMVLCNDHVSVESFSPLKRFVKFFSYFISDKVIVLTQNDKSYLSKFIPSKKVSVIPNISPFHGANSSSYESRQKIAIAVGRLSYQKNFHALVDLWYKANISDWELYIIGDGDEKDSLINKIKGYELDNVKLISAQKNISSWYDKASLILMTSRYEGLPMVLIESKNFGVPAISINCKTGPKEIICNDGYVVDDFNELKDRLNQLCKDTKLRKVMSENSHVNSSNYSPDAVINKWLNALKD